MAVIAQFSRDLRRAGDQIANGGARAIRRGVRAFTKAAILGTPVDTGEHRSNWRVGYGRRPGGTIRPYAPGKKLGINERANAVAAISAAEVQIRKIRPGRGFRVILPVYVVNNAPVISRLNAGQISTQQKPGWVDAAFAQTGAVLRNTRLFDRGRE